LLLCAAGGCVSVLIGAKHAPNASWISLETRKSSFFVWYFDPSFENWVSAEIHRTTGLPEDRRWQRKTNRKWESLGDCAHFKTRLRLILVLKIRFVKTILMDLGVSFVHKREVTCFAVKQGEAVRRTSDGNG
jgi:hypothetical protein